MRCSVVSIDVVYLAKVQISKQITTNKPNRPVRVLMLFTLQRYKFLSKSQQAKETNKKTSDVVYLAKVQISKQITTAAPNDVAKNGMLFTLQRYKFLSKSQRGEAHTDTRKDVVYLAKVQISKQITTSSSTKATPAQMLFTLQRYKFLSKSQQVVGGTELQSRCCLPCKGTNF